MIRTTVSEKAKLVYENECEVLHLDHTTPKRVFSELGPNSIISSYFTSFEAELRPASALGLKYVAEGMETYWVKGKKCEITRGKYLLVNESEPRLDVKIKKEGALGMCVNVDANLLNDLLVQVLFPNQPDEMQQVQRYFLSPELLVRHANASDNLQQLLNAMIRFAQAHLPEQPPIELLFELASMLVRENLEMIGAYYKLQVTKISTRQELFRRLLLGKEMLDDSIFTEVNIGQVAESCCLSEFRFYRLFRQCFGLSPYNYLFRRRIEKGLELKNRNISWSEIAYQLNFTDLAAFSKGFKKITGVSPSSYML